VSSEERFYLEYLHKRDVEPIFDVLKYKYFRAKRVVRWSFNRSKVTLVAKTEPPGENILVEVVPLGKKALMIRAGVGRLPPLHTEPLLVKESLEKTLFEVTTRAGELVVSTSDVSCHIDLSDWRLYMKNREGEVFFEEYLRGLYRSRFPVYPLCYKTVGEEKHFIESIALTPREAVYGFGERFGRLNKRGQRLFMWNSDTTMTSSDRSYKSIPFYVSSRGYGLFVKTGTKMLFEVGSEYCYNALSLEVWWDYLEYIVFYGPSFKEILKMYTELTGRPPLPPLWSFGLWMSRCAYRNRREVEEVAEKLREHQIPCDVINIDPPWLKHYCDLEWNTENFPNPEEMLRKLARKGFKICLWIQPYVPKGTPMYEEGARKGYFVKNKRGEVYNIIDFVKKEVGIVDFTNPGAREWYKRKLKKLYKIGVNVFKCDMGEAVPEDAVFHDGTTGVETHNLYPLYYQGTVYEAAVEALGEGLVWGRSGCAGIQRYPVQWSGDSHTTFEDMACVLRGGLSYSMSGVPFWSHDIGGFQGPKPSSKLYIRWSQWGLLSSHSRCHGTTPREPWEYGEEALKIFKKFAGLRYSLLPYLYSCAREASEEGLPVVRPLVLEFQEDPTVREIDLEYLLGPFILVVPVFSENDEVEYYLPKCLWLDWWTRKPVEGGHWVKEKVPLDRIPLFIREDSIIPSTTPMNYVYEKPYSEIKLEIFLRKNAELKYCFDGEKFDIGAVKDDKRVTISLGESKKKWTMVLLEEKPPREILAHQCRLVDWSYSKEEEKITIKVDELAQGSKVEIVY